MPGIKELKTRIKSIGSTRKITRAMQMVSAAKMRKAQAAVVSSRTYSSLAWNLINNVSGKAETEEPLMKVYPEAKKIGVILLGTNRGLVGSLNSNLAKLLDGASREVISEIVVYGRKAKQLAQRTSHHILADFEKTEKKFTSDNIYPLSRYITQAYISGEYKSIVIVYNHFVSTIVQRPTAKQLLPFGVSNQQTAEGPDRGVGADSGQKQNYVFEPTPKTVLEHLIPRIIESQIYQTILESDASEHSARMVMMKNATEAAGDLIHNYTLSYNQLRQNKITTELAEITAGKIALE